MPTPAHPAGFWLPPLIWRGATVCVLGGGPSFPDCWKRLGWAPDKSFLLGVNNSLYDVPNQHVHIFNDERWWFKHREVVEEASKRGVVTTSVNDELRGFPPCIRVMKRAYGFHPNRDMTGWYGNTGASAIELAMKMGARKIVLVGFDLRLVEGKPNYFDNYISPADNERMVSFVIQVRSLVLAARSFFHWVEVVNATPGSALQEVPFIPPEQALNYTPDSEDWEKRFGELIDLWAGITHR